LKSFYWFFPALVLTIPVLVLATLDHTNLKYANASIVMASIVQIVAWVKFLPGALRTTWYFVAEATNSPPRANPVDFAERWPSGAYTVAEHLDVATQDPYVSTHVSEGLQRMTARCTRTEFLNCSHRGPGFEPSPTVSSFNVAIPPFLSTREVPTFRAAIVVHPRRIDLYVRPRRRRLPRLSEDLLPNRYLRAQDVLRCVLRCRRVATPSCCSHEVSLRAPASLPTIPHSHKSNFSYTGRKHDIQDFG
jgi:hypothetical protein